MDNPFLPVHHVVQEFIDRVWGILGSDAGQFPIQLPKHRLCLDVRAGSRECAAHSPIENLVIASHKMSSLGRTLVPAHLPRRSVELDAPDAEKHYGSERFPSVRAQRDNRIDGGGTARRRETRCGGDGREQHRHRG